MDWKISSNPFSHENNVRKENSFIPEGSQILSPKKVEILNYTEPMRIAQDMETKIDSILPNSGDCVSVALMGAGSTTVHVQHMRVMSTEINFATTADGYQIYCPPSKACLMHEGRNIFILQKEPTDLFISSKICDTDITKMKPKHTMKSYVLNPEAKEFIPFNLREDQSNCKSLSVDVNNPVNNISNEPVENITAQDNLIPCSNVASKDFKVEIDNCSLTHEHIPLLMESTSSNSTENTCTCPISSNLNDTQPKPSSDQDLLMALTECFSLCQFPENELKVTSSCLVVSEPETEINSELGETKPLASQCGVKEESGVVEGLCPKMEGCGGFKSEELESVSDINKQSGKCQNFEIDGYSMVLTNDEEFENCHNSDDDWEDEESSEKNESSEEDENSDETEDEENENSIYESSDDDVTVCFAVDDTQESDSESDVEDSDSDFEIDDDNNNNDDDYACDLFEVEFNDDEVVIPMDSLLNFISDLSRTDNSGASDEITDFLDYSDQFDDVDSSGFLEEREEILQVNKRWNEAIDLNWCSCTPVKVTFSDDVKIFSADDYCRKSPWEMHARDRMRFQKRIEETESILNGILSPEHRCKVLSRLQTMEKK